MSRTIKGWVKFHFVNFAHNRDLDRQRPRVSGNAPGTKTDMLNYCLRMWSGPNSEVSEENVREVYDHLLNTKQIETLPDGSVTVGRVLFEDFEATVVSPKAQEAAKEILASLDDRRGSPTQSWAEDVRDEAVNSWAAVIDKHMGTTPP